MEGKTVVLGIVLLGLLLGGLLIIASNGGTGTFAGQRQTGMMGDSDRMFIEEMIPHHQDAVDMGNLALEKAEHPELRQLAQTIIRDQSKEISLMREWYRAWYGTDVPADPGQQGHGMGMMGGGPGMGMGMGGSGMGGNMTDLGKLARAPQFDKEFIEQMIPHHTMAIMMARMMTQNSRHAEIRELGSSIIRTQSAEVELMQRWYRAWYGQEPGVTSSPAIP